MARLNVAQDEPISSASDSESQDSSTHKSKRESLKQLGKTIKHASKRKLRRLNGASDEEDGNDHHMDADRQEIEGITDNPAFNNGEVLKKQEEIDDQDHNFTQSISSKARGILHPHQKSRQKAAQAFHPTQHPFLTPKADRELLEAHEGLRQEGLDEDWRDPNDDAEKLNESIAKVNKLESERANMKDAWITSRHVQRARIARPGLIPFPDGKDYRVVDEQGNFVRFQWERYFGHILLHWADDFGSAYIDDSSDLSFRRETLLRQIERVYLSSMHWQTLLMHIRVVYRWEDPILTMRWLLTWLFLLKTGYVMTFLYSFIVFIVVRNRYFPTATTELRWSHERIMNEDKHVFNFSELINRHGGDKYLEPLLDELGPVLQQQLGDLADYLEIMYNFYNWEDPRATTYTVTFWISCALVAGFTSTGFGNKVVLWIGGLYFFFSRPIATRFPRYRHLVSIFRWPYWQIPTHAELAFQHLNRSAHKNRSEERQQRDRDEQTAESFVLPVNAHAQDRSGKVFGFDDTAGGNIQRRSRSSSRSGLSSSSQELVDMNGQETARRPRSLSHQAIISFRGTYESRAGRLIVTESGIRLEQRTKESGLTRQTKREIVFSYPYRSLLELQKLDSEATRKRDKAKQKLHPLPKEELILLWTDGSETRIAAMDRRDECFNTIIGFSGERWQVLQPHQEPDGLEKGDSGSEGKTNFGGKGKGAYDELSELW